MAIGDWFLSRSEGFRLIIGKVRDHKITTKRSFSKVKRKHTHFERRFEQAERKIKEIERIISELYEIPIIKKKKK